MNNTKTLTLTANPSIAFPFQIGATISLLILSVLLPFAVHLIPSGSPIPVGAQILPMFIAPFIAILFFRVHVAIILAAIAPILNALLFGKPDPVFTLTLTAELIAFVSVASVFKHWAGLRWVNAPVSLIIAKLLVAMGVFILPLGINFSQAISQFTASISIGAIGIFIIWIVNIIAVSYLVKESKRQTR